MALFECFPVFLGEAFTGGIWVVNSVYNWGGASANSAADPVKATKACPSQSPDMPSTATTIILSSYSIALHEN